MTDTKLKINYFANDGELIQQLSVKILNALQAGIEVNDTATLVVSGGSTPKALFNYLSLQDFAWEKVNVLLADDRCVDTQSDDSNYHLLNTNLLINKASSAQFISLYSDEDTAEEAAIIASKKINKLPYYDFVILGMGTDGHTASLFPQAENLPLALSDKSPDVVAIDPVTNDMMRVTQSLKKLLASKNIVFHLIGEAKNNILQKVLQDTNKTIYPSSHIIHQDKVPVEIFYASIK